MRLHSGRLYRADYNILWITEF